MFIAIYACNLVEQYSDVNTSMPILRIIFYKQSKRLVVSVVLYVNDAMEPG